MVRLLFMAVFFASGPALWIYLRHRRASPAGRAQALVLVSLFLTFDLVMFGAFTRLTDSGLGCPDWPGCYGHASPLGASLAIDAAQQALPSGPVTSSKAWIEMVHRYLAMVVGVLITVSMVTAWNRQMRQKTPPQASPWLPTITWVWVCIQGAFGALTVTMKLFPAIVTLHLLGGYVLLALLSTQAARLVHPAPSLANSPQRPVSHQPLGHWIALALGLLMLQSASGAWVSSNYAVLVCSDFPTCQGAWLPSMDFAVGFEIWRPLGLDGIGNPISFQALTAIHVAHRALAMVTLLCLLALAVALERSHQYGRFPRVMMGLLGLQLLTGISNAVLGWPLLAAVIHTGGAGAMVVTLVWMFASPPMKSRP